MGTATYTHNPSGQRTKLVQGTTTTNYVYGFFGNLRSVTRGTTKVEYRSDVKGQRVSRKLNGVVNSNWLYDREGRIIGETDASGALKKRFVYGSKSNVPDQMVTDSVSYAI